VEPALGGDELRLEDENDQAAGLKTRGHDDV
jgi:hypothetical protein